MPSDGSAQRGCVAVIEIVGLADERQQSVKDACELVAQRLSVALDSLPDPAPAPANNPPTSGARQVRRASLGSSAGHLSESDARFVARRHSTPATFPKRAPTLLCRATRAPEALSPASDMSE